MLKFFTVIILYFLLTINGYSQSDSLSGDFWNNKILHFRFKGLSDLNLNSFDGGIGFSVRLSTSSVVRSMVSFRNSVEVSDNNFNFRTGNQSIKSIGIHVDYLAFGNMRSSFRPYWGIGGGLFGSNLNYKLTDESFAQNEFYMLGIYLSLNLISGVEYFVKDNITLSAEYVLFSGFEYSESGSHRPSIDLRERGFGRVWKMGISSLGLTASFYF